MPRNQSGTRNGVAGRYDQYGDFYADKPAVMPVTSQDWVKAKASGDTARMDSIKKSLVGQQTATYGANQARTSAGTSNLSNAESSGDTSGGSTVNFEDIYGVTLDEYLKNIGGSMDKLVELANGDYNMVAKWLEHDYTLATGTDDQGRKDFILKVANDLEAKVGTIQFDYNTGVYRTKEDMALDTTRTEEDRTLSLTRLLENKGITSEDLTYGKDTALKRLSEDDATLNGLYKKGAEIDRTNQGEILNQRGLLTGTRDNTVGVGSTDVNKLEGDIQDKFDALARATGRTTEDINRSFTTGMAGKELTYGRGVEDTNLSADRSLGNINLTGNRVLEDLTTGARRGMEGSTDTYRRGIEEAERQRKARELQIQQERDRLEAEAVARASTITSGLA